MGQPVEGRAAGRSEPDVLAEPSQHVPRRDDPHTADNGEDPADGASSDGASSDGASSDGALSDEALSGGALAVDTSAAPAPAPRSGSRVRALWAFAGRHWLIGIFLAAAAVLRAAAMAGYRPVLWFNDSFEYVSDAMNRVPGTERPSGYSLFLIALQPLHSFAAVVAVQHLMGLASGVMVYALLRGRGLPDWGASLAALPVLFDAYQVQLEHLVMSDALFTFLITAAVFLLCRRDRPSVLSAVAAGALTGAAALVRTVGLPLLAVVAVCLLIRKAGWRQVGAAVAAGAIPVLAYAMWFHSVYGKFAITESDGPFLYSRVMAFAECSKINPPQDLRVLCDPRPPASRPSTPEYPWTAGNPLYNVSSDPFSPKPSKMAGEFALLAMRKQPLGYLRVTAVDTARAFSWSRSQTYPDPQTAAQYQFTTYAQPLPNWATFDQESKYQPHGRLGTLVDETFARPLDVYMRYFYLRGAMLGVILLIGAAWVVYGRRRGAPGLLPWCIAAALIVEPAATAGFSYRYVLATVPVACMAAGLAFVRSRTGRHAVVAPRAPQPSADRAYVSGRPVPHPPAS
jgi:Dolichyl-phosphate-mannose-protein mannosyltransferase